MILDVKPTSFLKGKVELPSSKSYSIRTIIVSGCGGCSTLRNLSNCDDALAAINFTKLLGAKILKKNNAYLVKAFSKDPNLELINVNESGTTLRFILPLIALFSNNSKIEGKGTLRGRPNKLLLDTMRKMGMEIKGTGANESVPIKISGGKLSAGKIKIDGSISSQFISALLIACPLLSEDTNLEITGEKMVSSDYVDMTIEVLEKAGIKIKKISPRKYFIKGNQKYKGLNNFIVPSDYGLAAFLLAAAALNKSNVTLTGYFNDSFIQADKHIIKFLKTMGVRFLKNSKEIKIKGPFKLKGGSFSLKNCPDLLPIMAVMALFAQGKTRLYDIAHARVKESDRITDLRTELIKIGADVREKNNELVICPKKDYKIGGLLDPHHDHRLAMAFTVLGSKIGVRIKDIECTRKSYPDFVFDCGKIRLGVNK